MPSRLTGCGPSVVGVGGRLGALRSLVDGRRGEHARLRELADHGDETAGTGAELYDDARKRNDQFKYANARGHRWTSGSRCTPGPGAAG